MHKPILSTCCVPFCVVSNPYFSVKPSHSPCLDTWDGNNQTSTSPDGHQFFPSGLGPSSLSAPRSRTVSWWQSPPLTMTDPLWRPWRPGAWWPQGPAAWSHPRWPPRWWGRGWGRPRQGSRQSATWGRLCYLAAESRPLFDRINVTPSPHLLRSSSLTTLMFSTILKILLYSLV